MSCHWRFLPLLLLAFLLVACLGRPEEPTPNPAEPGTTQVPTATIAVTATLNQSDELPVPPSATAGQTEIPPASYTPLPPTSTNTPLPPSPTATPDHPIYGGPPLERDDFGVQIHLHREELEPILDHLRNLDVGWVKVQVSWKLYQPEPNRYDDFRFGELDRLISAAASNDVKVLLSVAKAPEWSRPTTELDGPPIEYDHFRAFMNLLAINYRGRVAAYELWNEPNLQREWNGAPLSAVALTELVRVGAAGVRAADPEALLISPAPATTGINDGVTAIDDRIYLGQMVEAGMADVVGAIGVHPYGWANPPDSTFLEPDPAAPSHNDHPSFFFADTLRDYRGILDQAGYPQTPLWVTEFGWGSFDGLGQPPPPGVEYMAAVSEWQQAAYTQRAYELAHQWEWVGPLILWNLNFGPTFGPDFSESGYSLLRSDGAPRPVYSSLTTIPKE